MLYKNKTTIRLILFYIFVSLFNSACKKTPTTKTPPITIEGKWRYQKENYVIFENGKKIMDTFNSYQPTFHLFEYKSDNTKFETSEDIPRIKVKQFKLEGNLLTETAGINTLPGVDTFVVPVGETQFYVTQNKDTIILNDSSVFNLDGKTEVRRSIKTYYSKY